MSQIVQNQTNMFTNSDAYGVQYGSIFVHYLCWQHPYSYSVNMYDSFMYLYPGLVASEATTVTISICRTDIWVKVEIAEDGGG